MEKLRSYFFFDYKFKNASLWFKKLLYIYLIFRSIQWLAQFKLLFGEHSLVLSQYQSIGFIKDFAFLVYQSSNQYLSLVALIGLLFLVITRLFTNKFAFFFDFSIWFLVLNLHNKVYPSLTGGDILLNQFLFFNCFLSGRFSNAENLKNNLQKAFHNFAVTAVILQICLVYFMSGLAKLGDENWMSGKALVAVSQIRHFSIFPSNYHSSLDPVYLFLNYLVLSYQVLFPILIWINKIKKPLLWIGILMHLYIGILMGLPEFSAVMIIGYVFFWPQKAMIK